jgi:hypothetical protein
VKNITVSVDDETYRRARMAAAANDTSVSALVGGFLREIADPQYGKNFALNLAARERLMKRSSPELIDETSEERFERLKREEIELRKSIKGFNGGDRLSRDELYDRSKSR